MKKPFIKFCGFQSVRDVQKVSRLPVDAVGFILVPGRRQVRDPQPIAGIGPASV